MAAPSQMSGLVLRLRLQPGLHRHMFVNVLHMHDDSRSHALNTGTPGTAIPTTHSRATGVKGTEIATHTSSIISQPRARAAHAMRVIARAGMARAGRLTAFEFTARQA